VAAVRPPVDTIHAPAFPRDLSWVNVAPLRMDKQRGRPVLIEFFDFCRVHSLRTLPYVQAWHARYADAGLRVISVHAPGFPPGRDEDVVREAVARLGIEHPVCLDTEFALWQVYDNEGWPARYLFGPDQILRHFGPLRPEDDPDAMIVVPTAEQQGAYSGPYEAGGVWAVLSGEGVVRANGSEIAVTHPGAYALVQHLVHTAGVLELEVGDGVECHATCFTPGLAG
jgi:hypothetical protein